MKYFGKDPLCGLIKLGLFLGVIALPLHTTTCNITLAATSVLSVIWAIRGRRVQLNVGFLPVIIFPLILLSMLYSENMKVAVASLELYSSWLFIPLIFGLAGTIVTHDLRDKLLIAFVGSVFVLCVTSYVIIAFRSGHLLPPRHEEAVFYYQANPFSRVAFEQVTGIHPSYLSVYLLFSMVIIARLFPIRNWIKTLLLMVIFMFMLLLSAKNQIVLFFLLTSVVIWNYIHLRRRYKASIIILVTALALVLGVANDDVRYRFGEELGHTLGERVMLWSSGAEIIGNHPILGVGVGDTDDSVNKEMAERKYPESLRNFNLHNQYLDFWLMLGLPGLIAFVLILLAPFKYGDFEFRLFVGIVAFSLLTESMMYRQKGLVFFLMIYGICGASYMLKKDSSKKESTVPSIS